MKIIKFRPNGLLAEKSLYYDELFFSSTEELNDPGDLLTQFEFDGNSQDIWRRLCKLLFPDQLKHSDIADYLHGLCPLSYNSLMHRQAEISSDIIYIVFDGNTELELLYAKNTASSLFSFLDLYKPSGAYSVSFAKHEAAQEILMWSHYASSHRGFCLVFNTIDGMLSQCPARTKVQLEFGESFFHIPANFPVHPITYADNVPTLNAFKLFPGEYTGLSFRNLQERGEFHANHQKQFLMKSACWADEKELRLVINQPSTWRHGSSELKPYQRLFHYDNSQLVGIIFGARMNSLEKETLKHIVNSSIDKRLSIIGSTDETKTFFPFLIQQAEFCNDSRKINLRNVELYQLGRRIDPESPDFERCYSDWLENNATVFEGDSMSNIQIL